MGRQKRVAKVPMMMQLATLECGASSLAMILAYHGRWITMEQARIACSVSKDGSSARNIVLAARGFGLEAKGMRMEPDTLKKEGRFPCIIHWNMNHFVVLKGFRRRPFGGLTAEINDPARGEVSVSMQEFDESFTGIVLFFQKSADFQPGGHRKSMLSFAVKRLAGAWSAVLFLVLTSVLMYICGVANTVTSRIYIDRILSWKSVSWITYVIPFMFLIAVMQISVAWKQAVYSLKISGKLAVTGASSYMWKVVRLPMNFFLQRMAGDIQMRLTLNASIAETLINTLAPLLLNTVMMLIYLFLMIRQSVLLTAIGVTAILINILLSVHVTKKRMQFSRVLLRDEGKLEAATFTGIEMIETIKSSGAENSFFQKWAGIQASVNEQKVKLAYVEQYLGQLPALFVTIANSIVLVMGVRMVMEEHMSLGGLFMFQGFMAQFMAPAMDLVRTGQTIQDTRVQMERIEDVMEYEEDVHRIPDAEEEKKAGLLFWKKARKEEKPEEPEMVGKLQGNVELRNITFGYSKLAEPVIKDFSLAMKTGDRVALVGASGCGKSTVSSLISGLYQPWSGEILFDGKPRECYPRETMTGSVAVVDQDILLFEGTVADNIKMWDRSIKDFEMIMAANDADIHEDIIKLSGGYRHSLLSAGQGLSGGQKQQLEIARALAQDPTILIFDEATSALDARTEQKIMEAVKARGITCVVIAHRLSTVRDCDEIIVLEHGEVCERGTHEELLEMNGRYKELVTNE